MLNWGVETEELNYDGFIHHFNNKLNPTIHNSHLSKFGWSYLYDESSKDYKEYTKHIWKRWCKIDKYIRSQIKKDTNEVLVSVNNNEYHTIMEYEIINSEPLDNFIDEIIDRISKDTYSPLKINITVYNKKNYDKLIF